MQKNKLKLIKKEFFILILIGIIFIAVLLLQVFSFPSNTFNFFIRLFALWGYICLAIAAMMTPFLKEIYKMLGRPFLKVHHIFAFSGLALITLHPAFIAIQGRTLAVFIPQFASWYDFWLFAGRPALIILYLALISVLFRRKFKPWRIIHALMYLMLTFGFVHAVLIGTDFDNIGILIIYSILFTGTIASFVAKRVQLYKSLKKKKTNISYL